MPKTTRPAIGATDTCDYCGRPIVFLEIHASASGAILAWTHVGSKDGTDGTICRAAGTVVERGIYEEWHEHHALSAAAVHWLATHGDPNDPHPIASGIELLRRLEMNGSVAEASDPPPD